MAQSVLSLNESKVLMSLSEEDLGFIGSYTLKYFSPVALSEEEDKEVHPLELKINRYTLDIDTFQDKNFNKKIDNYIYGSYKSLGGLLGFNHSTQKHTLDEYTKYIKGLLVTIKTEDDRKKAIREIDNEIHLITGMMNSRRDSGSLIPMNIRDFFQVLYNFFIKVGGTYMGIKMGTGMMMVGSSFKAKLISLGLGASVAYAGLTFGIFSLLNGAYTKAHNEVRPERLNALIEVLEGLRSTIEKMPLPKK